jgi:hypothetical protein
VPARAGDATLNNVTFLSMDVNRRYSTPPWGRCYCSTCGAGGTGNSGSELGYVLRVTANSKTIGPFRHSFTHRAEVDSDSAAHAEFFPQKTFIVVIK